MKLWHTVLDCLQGPDVVPQQPVQLGSIVGASVGFSDGCSLGSADGKSDGERLSDGISDGERLADGRVDGERLNDGPGLGSSDGSWDGLELGLNDRLGSADPVGSIVGEALLDGAGLPVGLGGPGSFVFFLLKFAGSKPAPMQNGPEHTVSALGFDECSSLAIFIVISKKLHSAFTKCLRWKQENRCV
jgi:hypothetical protein